MQTLYRLCLKKIVSLDLNINKLPNIIQKDIDLLIVKNTCGNIARGFIETEDFAIRLLKFGFVNNYTILGIIILDKDQMAVETMEYEKSAKKGNLHNLLMIRSLMSYYIGQELIFNKWYNNKQRTCIHRFDSICERCIFLNKIGA